MAVKYSEEELRTCIAAIRGADAEALKKAARHVQKLAAPPGSLGKLADAAVQLAGITGKVKNRADRCRIIVMCADNGVVEEDVSVTPPSVTLTQAVNMTRYMTGMSVLAKQFGCGVEVVDVGIDADLPLEAAETGSGPSFSSDPVRSAPPSAEDMSAAVGGPVRSAEDVTAAPGGPVRYAGAACGILPRKIRRSTGNILRESAMTRGEAAAAVGVGIERARAAAADGIELLGTGEMGIGNTTTSSAVLSVLTGLDPGSVTGRGGGLTDTSFSKKKEVISRAVRLRRPDPGDPIDVLAKVGGLDLAAMCGVFLGAAEQRIPVVIDGYISIVAALCAARLCPNARAFMFPSHVSPEPGYLRAAHELGLQPWLVLSMRLGEGSGCPLAFQILRAACALMQDMETFEEARIDDSYLDEIRTGKEKQYET